MIKSKMNKPVPMILDTDMGNDIDDALAMAMIHTMQSRGECDLLGVVSSKDNPYSPVYIDIVNTFYGRGKIPIGKVRDGVTPDDRTFIKQIATAKDNGTLRYPRTYQHDDYQDAVPLLRRLLASHPDRSVVILMIGFSTNMAQLLDSPPDTHSALNGHDLFAKKVDRVVAMAGNFSPEVQDKPTLANREYNIHCDVSSAMRFFNHCPAPIMFCGYEVGFAMLYPSQSIVSDYAWAEHHPVAHAYVEYMKMPYDRPLWDPATVLEAVRPGAGYFQESEPGRVTVDELGIVRFKQATDGHQRYLKIHDSRIPSVVNEIVSLCSRSTVNKSVKSTRVPQSSGS